MISLCDLHTHSTASDGQYTPSELARLVHRGGAEVWALTDHDTLRGLSEAAEAAQTEGLRFVPGIELGAREYHTYHILGYGFDPADPGLAALCERMQRAREERGGRIEAYLRSCGMEVPEAEAEALAGGQVLGRPHFAQLMQQRGYVASVREAFDRWLDTEAYHAAVPYEKPAARECVETIRAAGGWVSLAHPYQIGIDDRALEDLVRELTGYGLNAIECCYPRYTPEQQALYRRLAERFGLRATGGSDFHGERVKPDIEPAAYPLELDWLFS